jgi:hypothetical protein
MSEIIADPPCYHLFSSPGILGSQQLSPDPFLPRARDARGRFAKGSDPAERLGIDLTSLRTVEDLRHGLSTVLAAVSRGEIAPAEAARIARRGRARLRAVRRLARLAPVRA